MFTVLKLIMGTIVDNAPAGREWACKWVNTSSLITRMDLISTSGNHNSDTNIRIWGSN